ncbi:MAG TPA: pepsin/retropepsin-like aspartic protease family protein [Candidatus Limnocylindria bacterium]|nr:pepsin/retropepsin-like aspartic protease family protein [Candidatus Limnocylindria bacterium]
MRLLALPAAALLSAATPSDDLAAIAAGAGHPAIRHFRATMSRVVEGRPTELTVEQLGATELVRRCVAGICAGFWFDGQHRWTFGINEIVLQDADDAATPVRRTLAAIASYAFAEPAFRSSGGTVTAAGPGRWRVRAAGGAELVAVVDPPGRTLRRVETPGGQTLAEYGSETRAGGATYALDREGPFEPGRLDAVSVVPGPLAAPAGPAVTFANDASPLALTKDAVPIVPCTLAGRAARCLLDTGAQPSALALSFAEALGLEPRGELELLGFGRFLTGMVESGPLALGAARFERVRLAVLPSTGGVGFDIAIGADLLGRVRVLLDRRRGIARIGPPASAPAAGAIPLRIRAGSPRTTATLDGTTVDALLDTGDQATISLGYAQYREGTPWPLAGRGTARGIAGADDILRVTIPDVSIGRVRLGRTEATVRRTQDEPHVGVGLWTFCVVELDEQNGRLRCSPGGG